MRIAGIGLGLIGGAVAIAGRGGVPAPTAGRGFGPPAGGASESQSGSIRQAVEEADAAFVAAPVNELPELVAEVLRRAPDTCVVTDVGSTKRAVVGSQTDPRFVGGHPLAGAETSGIEHARGDLFAGATWYLTPTAATDESLCGRLRGLLERLGAHPVAIDAADHDRLMATVSHLPHVLANVLVSQLLDINPSP